MSRHFKIVCRECGKVIGQCKCMEWSKHTVYARCAACVTKVKLPETIQLTGKYISGGSRNGVAIVTIELPREEVGRVLIGSTHQENVSKESGNIDMRKVELPEEIPYEEGVLAYVEDNRVAINQIIRYLKKEGK